MVPKILASKASIDKNKKTPIKGKQGKLGLFSMTLLVVSAMFGGGVFNIPQNMAESAALGAILISWLISSVGIFFLARNFQILTDIRPNMTSGIYMYARAGFGKFAGFLIAWGYWLSVAFGNVGYAVLLMDALNYFFPPYFSGGNTWQATLGSSAIVWSLCFLVMRGVKAASLLNNIGTLAKFVPITLFLTVVLYFSVNRSLFTSDFWGNVSNQAVHDKPLGDILEQIKSTMLVTLWMYIGIESAVVMSDKSDARTVGRATLLGYLLVTVLFVLVSVLPFGVMSQGQLASIAPPSTAAILGSMVGLWGEVLINVGVIIALLSSWLVWTLLVAELPFACAGDGTFPKVFKRTNSAGIASVSLVISTVIMQAAIILVYFSDNAWNLMLSITGVVLLPAYITSSAFLWKLIGEGSYPEAAPLGRRAALAISLLATGFGVWLIFAAGLQFMLAAAIIYAAGVPVFLWARKSSAPRERVFTQREAVVAAALVLLAAAAISMLVQGLLPEVYAG